LLGVIVDGTVFRLTRRENKTKKGVKKKKTTEKGDQAVKEQKTGQKQGSEKKI